jgi:hypothetical protein
MSTKPKQRTISHDPYAFIEAQPEGSPAQQEQEQEKPEATAAQEPGHAPATEKITTPFPGDLIERVRNAAYWERLTLTGIIVQAVTEAVARMEQERGESYPPRKGELKGGRPIGSGKTRNPRNT